MNPQDKTIDSALLARMRETLDVLPGLSLAEQQRLQQARQAAVHGSGKAPSRWRLPLWRPMGAVALAASVMLAVVLIWDVGNGLGPEGLPALAVDGAEVEWLLAGDEADWLSVADDVAFVFWATQGI
ncbi:hypothetical protein SAMN05216526_1676 [Ectothiorhodosinus mongolicus]|uniref:Uncharacterized protein n=1 Tax=Ectothiorhodosinus mongolicus TaxID=233100 RepID=A0A1R3W4N4_9GAMM|nr:hypothetical protein [Ectothiorhodosinus mongolicus]ULX57506.1 hypothetical protein CKX93_07405 [Ectothiorhodosinus mongolicus]SIT72540.1 hypothetical protein SAMN05216526_1676 [Ectothiorhodosinus mongolicus]